MVSTGNSNALINQHREIPFPLAVRVLQSAEQCTKRCYELINTTINNQRMKLLMVVACGNMINTVRISSYRNGRLAIIQKT